MIDLLKFPGHRQTDLMNMGWSNFSLLVSRLSRRLLESIFLDTFDKRGSEVLCAGSKQISERLILLGCK